MSISLLEQETIILYNRAEKTASVYTFEPTLKRKLKSAMDKYPELVRVVQEEDSDGVMEFEVPKDWIKVTPKVKKTLSEEEKKIRVERLSKVRKEKK